MLSSGLPVRTRAQLGVAKAPVVPFPSKGKSPAKLRKLRDQFFREGRLDLAVQVAEQVAEAEPSRADYFRLGFLYREMARYRDALKVFRDALRFAEGPAYLLPEIHLHIAHTWFLLGHRKRMKESLRRAYATRWKPRSSPKFHMALGTEHFERRRYREAAEEYARAEAASTGPLDRGRNALNQGIACYRLGQLEQAQIHLDRALRLQKRHGHQLELATVRMAKACICFEQGHFLRGVGILERAVATFHRYGKADREAEALMNAGYCAGEMKDWDRSKKLLDRSIAVATQGQHAIVAAAYSCRATANAAKRDFDQAQQDITRAKAELRGHRDWFGTIHLCRAEGRIARMLGSWKEVRRAARVGERNASKAGDIYRVMEFRRMRAEAEKALGRPKAFERAVQGLGRLKALVEVSSPDSRKKSQTTERLASSDLPILLIGPADTGKVEIAREMHKASPRRNGPCIVVPCEQLVFPAADLGGHAAGAWSGAEKESIGMVHQAEKGTLILDRVDELAADAQRLLVRIVDGQVRPVGAPIESAVDVRIIATCQDPERLTPELRNRLSGAVLPVASLGERPETIVRMVRERLAGRREITPDAVAELLKHPWDGNHSELQAVLERLVAHSEALIGRKLVLAQFKTPKGARVDRRGDHLRQLVQVAGLQG